MTTPRLALAAATCLFLIAGCGSDVVAPRRSSIDVDTPELRAMKAAASIETCASGEGGRLPSLRLPCLGGGPEVDLASLSGPLVINLWTSSCVPCRKEMPALQAFYVQHGDTVPVLGIDGTDNYPEAALALAEETGATYPQLADPNGDLYDQPDLSVSPGFPQFILLDADGEVAYQAAGGIDSADEVVAMVETHLGVDL